MTQEPPPGEFDEEADLEEPADGDFKLPPDQVISSPEEPEDLASVIVIDRNDDVSSVCGRIDATPTYWVIVHAPRGNRSLSTELGMRRLKRHAEESGRAVAFATHSPGLTSRARQMGIPAARRPEAVRWHAGGRAILSLGRGRALVLPRMGRYVQWFVLVAIIVGLGAVLLTLAPSATVVAYPDSRVVTVTTRISGSEELDEIDVEARAAPSTTVSATHVFTLVLPATGTTTRPAEPARTIVEVTNPTDGTVTVDEGTVVLTAPDFLAFSLDEAITLEPGASQEAGVTAFEGGEQYNVETGAIVGWLDEEMRVLTVTNPLPATGGGVAEVAVVAAEDVIAIRELEQLIEAADATKTLLAEERPNDAVFLDSLTVEGSELAPPTQVGTETDLVVVEFQVTVTGLAIVADDLEAIAREILVEEAGEGEFIEGSVRAVELGDEVFDSQTGEIEALFEVSGEFVEGVTADEVRDAVKGKSLEDAEATLMERYGMEQAEVSLTPGFAPWVPRFGFRIDVEFRAEPEEAPEENADDDAEGEDAEDAGT